jgi:hypothetical protein
MLKKTNREKLAKALAQLAEYNNGHLSRKADAKSFAALNQRISMLRSEILKENKINHGLVLAKRGFGWIEIQNIFDNLNLNCADFQILNEIK